MEDSVYHKKTSYKKTDVILINLGTPDKLSYWSIRKYLKTFLSDRRVIEVPRFIWFFILNGIILTIRPFKVIKKYRTIWMNDIDTSPLKYYTQMQAKKLDEKMKDVEGLSVKYAMCYSSPRLEDVVKESLASGTRKIVFMTSYPQYSATTTAAAFDQVFDIMKKVRFQPEISLVHHYHDHPSYIAAVGNSVIERIKSLDWTPQGILMLFHGIPKKYFSKGDPYYCFCAKTHRLVSEYIAAQGVSIKTHFAFQSRFGPAAWLQPYAEDKMKELIADDVKNIVTVSPGFFCDCLETIEEVGMEYREYFAEVGGDKYDFVPCLNDSEPAIAMLEDIVKDYL